MNKKIVLMEIIIILTAMSLPASSVEYVYEEDFVDNNAKDWSFWGGDWTAYNNGGNVTEIEHNFVVENEKLISNRNQEQVNKIDYAYQPLAMTYGAWSMDVNRSLFLNWGFWLKVNDLNWNGVSEETIEPDYLLFLIGTSYITLLTGSDPGIQLATFSWAIQNKVEYKYDFIRTPDSFLIYIDNQQVLNHSTSFDQFSEFNYFGVMASVPTTFDNFQVTSDYNGVIEQMPETEPQPGDDKKLLYIGLGSLGFIAIAAIFYKFYGSKIGLKKKAKMNTSKSIEKISSQISDLSVQQEFLYALITGQTNFKNDKSKSLIDSIPTELINQKFLLHPVRMSIMKLLVNHSKLSSIQIKSRLKISWGDYTTHISSLEKRNYLSVRDEFEDNVKRQFVYLEHQGEQDYQSLMKLLKEFIDDNAELSQYISYSKNDDLYPQTN